MSFSVLIRCRGTLSARRSEQITAPTGVTDLQIMWLAPSGGQIKEGDPIVRFDRSKLEQELLEKRAALRQAQASLDQGEAQAHMRTEQDKVDISSARYQSERAGLEASKKAIVSASDGAKSAIDQRIAEEKVVTCKVLAPISTSNPTKPRTLLFAVSAMRRRRNFPAPNSV